MMNISRSTNQKLATLSGVMLALLLCLAGCKNERFTTEEDLNSRGTADFEGSTYMTLALRNTPPTSDPTTPKQGEEGKESATGEESFTIWQGDDIIDNFAVYIVSEGIDKVQPIAGKVTDTDKVENWDPVKQELLLKPFPTAPVSKQIFAFFNIPTQYQKYLDEKLNNKKEFLERISEPIPYMGAENVTYDQDAPTLDAFRPDSHIATKVIATDATIPDVPSFTADGRPGRDSKKPRANLDFPNSFFDKRMDSTKPGLLPFVKRKDRILSSGVRDNYLPEDYVTADEVKNDKRNLVQVYTRRVLAQAVVTAEAALANTPIPELGNMVIKGVSFQVLNFEPTFFPIAKTTKEGEWPGNENTVTPLYGQKDNSSLINMSTYKSTFTDEKFTADALVRDRFFRSAHFVYGEGPTELDPAGKDYAQKLLRETEYSKDCEIDGKLPGEQSRPTAPDHTTTFWGSCYVTESTHKWGTDVSSGYNTSNTPFFAIVAYFDTEKLPWGDKTITTAKAKIDNKQKDLEEALKAWRDELAAKKAELASIPEGGGSGGMSEADADAIFQAYVQWWKERLGPLKTPKGRPTPRVGKYVDKISNQRELFKKGTTGTVGKPPKTLNPEELYLYKIKTDRNTLRSQDPKKGKKLPNKKNVIGTKKEFDVPENELDEEQKAFKKTLEADRKLIAGDPNAKRRQQLNSEIDELKKKIEDFEKEFKSSGEKYPKLENSTTNKETYTQFIYEQGINRIFYSKIDHKFYLNYHEIPRDNRDGQQHTLTENDQWLKELKSKLPNNKDFPTEKNGAPATAAVLPPSADLMSKLSQLLNGDIKETDLNPAERRSMDFYLYGRVAPGLVQYFGGAKRIDRIDLQSGYVAWYTANKRDNVVSYPCYVRNKEVDTKGKEKMSSISNVRLLMVYYAWLNPNSLDPSNRYASPVLRNNIYHMHITGFTKMGLSAIPFVPRVIEGKGYKFLHAPFDPDEEVQVPAANAPLVNTGGVGQPTVTTSSRSMSRSFTF